MSGMVNGMSGVSDHDAAQSENDFGRAQSSQTAMHGYVAEGPAQATTCVRATYDTGEVRFNLPHSATIAQLIERLAIVGRGHGAPVSVEVLIEPTLPLS
jgi:hypothetical protein